MEEVKKDKKFEPKSRENRRSPRDDGGFENKLVTVRRVTKVVKGGRTLRFSALVVVGDGKNSVGIGVGKSSRSSCCN